MEDNIYNFLKEINVKFNSTLSTEELGFNYYIRTDCSISENRRYFDSYSEKRMDLNPLLFLTELEDKYSEFDSSVERAKSPYLSFVIGQYGQGKTELVKQICNLLIKDEMPPLPLPISLVRCRKKLISAFEGQISMEALLFSSFNEEFDQGYLGKILDLISTGKIILLLDGLDELIQGVGDPRSLFRWFVEEISKLFFWQYQFRGDSVKSKVIVTMREEFLSIVSNKEATDITKIILSKRNSNSKEEFDPNVYFLNINFFDDSRISAYIKKRDRLNPKGKILEEILKKDELRSAFRDIFHRPLLLRLLADWAMLKNARPKDLLRILVESSGPAKFIELYINTVAEDSTLKSVQDQILACRWDPHLIAKRCLVIYEVDRKFFRTDDLRKIVVPVEQDLTGKQLTDEQAIEAVHKCPFLLMERVDNEIVFRFSHKMFYEYFVAYGMFKDYFPDKDEKLDDSNKLKPFDELVLNVDMRKLLRAFVKEDLWYEETRLSYGLNKTHWAEWNLTEVHNNLPPVNLEVGRKKLDDVRIHLLDLMSHPELFVKVEKTNIENTIQYFLSNQDNYHPRYLIFNYEAISVYIWNNSWDSKCKEIKKSFSTILEFRAQGIISGLEKDDFVLERAWLLLLERILHVSHKLKFSWVRDLKKVDEKIHQYGDANSQVFQRILLRLNAIAETEELW